MKLTHARVTVLVFFGVLLAGTALISFAQEQSSSTKNIFSDFDQDGLSDEEESMYGTDPYNDDTDRDGYKDGAEIKSGYDPLKPAPGDKLPTASLQSTNSTITPVIAAPSIPTVTATSSETSLADDGSVLGSETDSTAESTSEFTPIADLSTQLSTESNLTKRLAMVLAQQTGGDPSAALNMSLSNIDSLIQQAVGNPASINELPPVGDDEFKIKVQNYNGLTAVERAAQERSDLLEYLTTIAYIAFENAPNNITQPADINKLLQQTVTEVGLFSANLHSVLFFDDLTKRAYKTMEQLKGIEVPVQFADIHREALSITKYGIQLNENIRPNPEDPVMMLNQLSQVQNFIGLTENLVLKSSQEFTALGVDVLKLQLSL